MGIIRNTTIYLYETYREVYGKAVELANREGRSFSELVSVALKEYVEHHFPGNPQLPLNSFEEFDDRHLRATRLEAKFVAESATNLLKILRRVKESRGEQYSPSDFHIDLFKAIIKLSKLNRRLGDAKYDELIGECELELV